MPKDCCITPLSVPNSGGIQSQRQYLPKLQAILNKQMKLKTEQADKLSELRTKLNDVLDPQGYTDADITQCGDHCAEVQIAAEHQAEILRQRKDAEREEEDRELNVPLGTRR